MSRYYCSEDEFFYYPSNISLTSLSTTEKKLTVVDFNSLGRTVIKRKLEADNIQCPELDQPEAKFTKVSDCTLQVSGIIEKLNTLQNSNDTLLDKVNTLQNSNDTLHGEVNTLRGELNTLQNSNDTLNDSVNRLRSVALALCLSEKRNTIDIVNCYSSLLEDIISNIPKENFIQSHLSSIPKAQEIVKNFLSNFAADELLDNEYKQLQSKQYKERVYEELMARYERVKNLL